MMRQHCLDSPVGPLTITADKLGITALHWQDGPVSDDALLVRAAAQLTDYFTGSRTDFTLPLRLTGTPFQRAVCAAISAIPFGETRTYGGLAHELGVTAQAIGQGCGANPIPILIPCHRVTGANGLGGFSGGTGIETKIWLLKHEGAAGLLI